MIMGQGFLFRFEDFRGRTTHRLSTEAETSRIPVYHAFSMLKQLFRPGSFTIIDLSSFEKTTHAAAQGHTEANRAVCTDR